MDTDMTEKKLALSLDDIISSSGRGSGRPAGKAAAQQARSAGKAKTGKPQRFNQGAMKVIPIPIRSQPKNSGSGSRSAGQRAVPGLKGVKHLPATSPARLQKVVGGGSGGRFKQTQQFNSAQVRSSKLVAHQAVGAAARQAAVAQKRGMKPIEQRLAPAQGGPTRSPLGGRLAAHGPVTQPAPKVDLAAGAKWKITIANDKAVNKAPPQSIIMPGQSNGAHKNVAAKKIMDRPTYEPTPAANPRAQARGKGETVAGTVGGLSDRFRQIRSGASVGDNGRQKARVTRNAAGVLMPF